MKKVTSIATLCVLLFSAAAALALFQPSKTKAIIKGKVTDKNGIVVMGAAIEIIDASGKVKGATTQTDANGNYKLGNLNAGNYNLQCRLVGYKTETRKNIVVKNDSATVVVDFIVTAATETEASETVATKQKNKPKQIAPSGITFVQEAVGAYHRAFGGGMYKKENNTLHQYGNEGSLRAMPAPIDDSGRKREDEFNTTDYNLIVENEFQRVHEKPLSTLSIDVDVASYSMVRSYLNNGQLPPKDAVRIEELINYFTYNYPQPKGNVPFAVSSEMSDCPWNTKHKLLHVGISGKEIEKQNLPPSNLVFLIDVSGSMQGPTRLGLVKQSLRMLVNELNEKDHIAMVVYAGASGVILPSTSCAYKDKILDALEKLEAGGSTAGAAGIELAYKTAKEHFLPNGNNRVILCTDGDFNVGISSDAELIRLIEQKREQGTFLSVLGYGMGNYKDNKMEQLADKGNGNYAYIDNIMEANKVLVQQMGATLHTIAKDVKIQIEFNPEKVKGYRLIGYENRLLADRDFNDDTKDAGEIGAGAGVTALYEIVTDENELKSLATTDKLKYQQTKEPLVTNRSNEWLNIKIRYKEPQGTTSKLIENPVNDKGTLLANTSDNFKFSAAVASFGMLLRDSKYKGDFDFDKVIALAKSAKGKDDEGYRAEFIRLSQIAKSVGEVSKK
jgi:Ca-activated chloride channel family protein